MKIKDNPRQLLIAAAIVLAWIGAGTVLFWATDVGPTPDDFAAKISVCVAAPPIAACIIAGVVYLIYVLSEAIDISLRK